jgi:hypothetical protein
VAAEDAFLERYLLVGLRLGKLIDGLVDAYYGPGELSARVEAEEAADPAALAAEAQALLAGLDGSVEGEQRSQWLRSQLIGLETVARRLAGEEISYVDEVERCYGVRPMLLPEEEFARAHAALDEVLPGTGTVKERYQAWEESTVVEREALLAIFDALTDELRARTAALIALPAGESVQLELVQNEPWLAFNYYLGGLRSRVAFNTDLPWRATDLFDVVAHELYPGHHTEHVLKEQLLVGDGGRAEETIFLVGTPQSLVNEAIATLAPEIVGGEDVDETAAELLRPLGVELDAALAGHVREHAETLGHIGGNAALMLHEQGVPFDEVRAYALRWSLRSDARVDKGLQFVTDPTWRAYVFCYTEGLTLARRFVDGDVARFRRLLTEQVVPADLLAAA